MDTDIDVALGVETKRITLAGKEYIIAPMGPFLLAEITAYIKELRREQIAKNAKDMGITDLVQVTELTNKPLTEKEFNQWSKTPEVMRMMIFYNLRTYQPDITLEAVAKLISNENLDELVDLITGEKPAKNLVGPQAKR